MLEEWIRKGKEDEQNNFLSNSKMKYLLVIVICMGLLALIWPSTKTNTNVSTPAVQETTKEVISSSSIKSSLARELEAILSQIDGVGNVNVSLTLSSEGIKTYASNIRDEKRDIQETDNRGGKKTTVEQNVTRDLAVSSGTPLLVEEKMPEILGVLVVADGASNPKVMERLVNATATLLDISPHKVTVMPRKGEI
ncbi:MAG: hypothetical protein GX790_07045 [Syntrophomonadaceae bacterium]|nr:hypothetical protein [Syntrophomonadaceae bacterium]